MQRINPMARLIALAGAMAAAASGQSKDLAAKLDARQQHDPQSGRYAYRGKPGTKAFQRAASKRRRVIAHRNRARA